LDLEQIVIIKVIVVCRVEWRNGLHQTAVCSIAEALLFTVIAAIINGKKSWRRPSTGRLSDSGA